MAASAATSKTASFHSRSISLPSRSHPIDTNVEDHLNRVKASCSSSSSSICQNLNLLTELHVHLSNLLQLPITQVALSVEQNKQWVEEFSLGLLEVCGSIKDILSMTKSSIQELESSIRRRSAHENGVHNFILTKRKTKILAQNCIKKAEKISSLLKCHEKGVAIFYRLREIEEISFLGFKSILSFINVVKPRSKQNGWSLVSKLIPSQRVVCETNEAAFNEVESLYLTLDAVKREKNTQKMQNLQNQLKAFELSIEEMEGGLECLFRRLLKNRVTLLNILNH